MRTDTIMIQLKGGAYVYPMICYTHANKVHTSHVLEMINSGDGSYLHISTPLFN